MAKILCNYFGLSMAAEGKSEFVGRQAAAFLGYVQQDAERCAENCGCAEDLSDAPEKIKREILRNDEELRRREQTAPGVEHDVVAIYDNAGIPSIMHRFRRVTNKELFGGSDAVHPAFIIGGEVYDEIYISVYENTMINGKPYSLPLQEPVTNITMEDFAQACFSKGEGWHCLTAAEWGLLADTSLKLGTLPHGNTNCSHWHGDDKEQGIIIEDSYKTLTGSGPATWTHDHTASGVHDLCGNIIEIFTSQIHRPGAVELLEWLESTDFFEAPASTHYHGSYPGGLVEHSLNVYYELIGAGRVPGVPTAETYAVVALLHDICKADFYAKSTRNQKNSDGKWETVPCYTVREKFPFGHGEKSAFLVQRFMLLTDAEALAIRWHMGAYDDAAKGGSKVLSAAMAATPLVYALHAADMRAEQKENAQQ